jgi:hypothetical protein
MKKAARCRCQLPAGRRACGTLSRCEAGQKKCGERKKDTFTQSLHDMLQLWLEMLDLNDEKSNI